MSERERSEARLPARILLLNRRLPRRHSILARHRIAKKIASFYASRVSLHVVVLNSPKQPMTSLMVT